MINKSPIFIVRVSYIFFSLLAIFRSTVYTLSVCLSFSFSLPILLFYFSRFFSLLLAKITLCRLGIKSRSCSDVIWHIIHCSVLAFSTFLKKWIKSRTKPRKSVQLLLVAKLLLYRSLPYDGNDWISSSSAVHSFSSESEFNYAESVISFTLCC